MRDGEICGNWLKLTEIGGIGGISEIGGDLEFKN